MADPAKNILIGLFVIAAVFLIAGVLLFLHPSVGDCAQSLTVRFANLDKITVGTRVTFAGRPVGEVLEVRQLPRPTPAPHTQNGKVYSYELSLCVDSSVRVYESDDIGVYTSGLLGERSIDIVPRTPAAGSSSRLITDEIIYAESSGSVDDALAQMGELAQKAGKTLDLMSHFLESNQTTINSSFEELHAALVQIKEGATSINQTEVIDHIYRASERFEQVLSSIDGQLLELDEKGVVSHISNTLTNLSDISDSLNETERWAEILSNTQDLSGNLLGLESRLDETLGMANEAIENFVSVSEDSKQAIQETHLILQNVRKGKGSIGKLLSEDDFYLRLSTLMAKVDTLMNDVNHYGLLFHREKGWQRTRTQRMRQAQCLRTPEEFHAHFSKESDRITTSLSRLGVLLEEAKEQELGEGCVEDLGFSKIFRELSLQVESLQHQIQLYNQQLVDAFYQEEYPGKAA